MTQHSDPPTRLCRILTPLLRRNRPTRAQTPPRIPLQSPDSQNAQERGKAQRYGPHAPLLPTTPQKAKPDETSLCLTRLAYSF